MQRRPDITGMDPGVSKLKKDKERIMERKEQKKL
jgi:hypothetical protein